MNSIRAMELRRNIKGGKNTRRKERRRVKSKEKGRELSLSNYLGL